jgi:hypothetical protein
MAVDADFTLLGETMRDGAIRYLRGLPLRQTLDKLLIGLNSAKTKAFGYRIVTPMCYTGSMEEVCKHPRLARRGRVYWFRAKVPVDLRAHYAPKKEITYSLRVTDPKEALCGTTPAATPPYFHRV